MNNSKRILALGLAGALALASGLAVADQVVSDNFIVKGSSQLLGHVHTGLGLLPVVTGTGTPTLATGSSDTAGEVTSGTSATSVVITFAKAYAAAPFCTVTDQSQITSFAYTISTTAITVTQTATSGNKIDYVCLGVGTTNPGT